MKITTIKKQSLYYNPYFLEGREIDAIVFYLEGEIVGITNWFQTQGSNNRYPSFNLNEEIKIKRKIDLNSKNSFLAKTTEDLNTYKSNYSLYINLANYEYKLLGEYFSHESDTYKSYKSKLEINLFAKKEDSNYNKEADKLEYFEVEGLHTITVEYGYRSEKKPKQLKVEKLQKLFEDNNLKIQQYEISKILDLCNLSVKRKK
jgi:hypothetical protein